MKCGLLGRVLGHSYSPKIHSYFADYSYDLVEREPDALENFLRNSDYHGLNVTMPYKKEVMKYLDDFSPVAKKLGAVNTIVRRNDGTLWGHNTDYFGFQMMLKKSGLDVSGKKCLVLGTGGASKTVVYALQELGAKVITISRTGENNYENIASHIDAALVVNATPVGMYPNNGYSPVSLDYFPALEGVLDLIYNPARTKLLLDAEAKGIIAMNGLLMLVAQAKEAAECFSGNPISDDMIEQVHRKLRKQVENIILIGMPGCGKSTLGAMLAANLGKKFADADISIENVSGMTIPEIFAQNGEAAFRTLETQVLCDLGKQSGMVIATGGGCVTKKENYPLLHQNGTIFWITRPLNHLPTDGRPLSIVTPMKDLYMARKPLYEAWSKATIDNGSDLLSAYDQLSKAWEAL